MSKERVLLSVSITQIHFSGAEEMALWVKGACSASMKAWVQISSAHGKTWIWQCMPVTLALGGRDRPVLGAHWPGSLSRILVQRESLLKTARQRVTEDTLPDVLLWLPHVQSTLACTCMHYSQSPTYKHTADIFNVWLVEYVGRNLQLWRADWMVPLLFNCNEGQTRLCFRIIMWNSL